MTHTNIKINDIPAVLYGDGNSSLYLFIHGKMGCKEEAGGFAESGFVPWKVVPELKSVMAFAKTHWGNISLRATSIGAWFSLLAFPDEKLEKCLFLSPVTDMEQLIKNMMMWANVSEKMLEEQKRIPTDFGEVLDIEYYRYAQSHTITKWEHPTAILYGSMDNLTSRETIERFADRFKCKLTVMENGEHWFHTKEQLDVLRSWQEKIS